MIDNLKNITNLCITHVISSILHSFLLENNIYNPFVDNLWNIKGYKFDEWISHEAYPFILSPLKWNPIALSFAWRSTPQGYAFWNRYCELWQNKTKEPLLYQKLLSTQHTFNPILRT